MVAKRVGTNFKHGQTSINTAFGSAPRGRKQTANSGCPLARLAVRQKLVLSQQRLQRAVHGLQVQLLVSPQHAGAQAGVVPRHAVGYAVTVGAPQGTKARIEIASHLTHRAHHDVSPVARALPQRHQPRLRARGSFGVCSPFEQGLGPTSQRLGRVDPVASR